MPIPTLEADAKPLREDELRRINAYWRAANYIAACQIYLLDNPLVKNPSWNSVWCLSRKSLENKLVFQQEQS